MGGGPTQGAGSSEYNGFMAPHVSPVHENVGKGMMVIMWFWIFHRAREDGKAVLVWNIHGTPIMAGTMTMVTVGMVSQWVKDGIGAMPTKAGGDDE